MTVPTGLLLYAIIWVLTLFVVLPLRLTSQSERGDIVRGTPGSAPESAGLKRKALIVTLVAAVLWAVAALVVTSGAITFRDLDWFGRMAPADGRNG